MSALWSPLLVRVEETPKSIFFFYRLFFVFVFFLSSSTSISIFLLDGPHSSFSSVFHTPSLHTILNCLCPISPSTFLKQPRPCPPSGPPKKTSFALLISLCVRYHRSEAAYCFASRKVFGHASNRKRPPPPPAFLS